MRGKTADLLGSDKILRMPRHLIRFALLTLTIGALAQETKESVWAVRRRLFPKLVVIFDLAQTAPAPLRAFAFLKIASSPMLNDWNWRRELIEESYSAAAAASDFWLVNPVAIPDGPQRTIATRVVKASQLNSGLDRHPNARTVVAAGGSGP